MGEFEELVLTIARHLELDWQYVERVEAWNAERIADVRSAGRRAGRRIGYKIATFQSDADDEGRVVVIVAVREPPNAEDHRVPVRGTGHWHVAGTTQRGSVDSQDRFQAVHH